MVVAARGRHGGGVGQLKPYELVRLIGRDRTRHTVLGSSVLAVFTDVIVAVFVSAEFEMVIVPRWIDFTGEPPPADGALSISASPTEWR